MSAFEPLVDQLCPLWHVPARVESVGGFDRFRVNSIRAGGLYELDRRAFVDSEKHMMGVLDAKLTSWLVTQRLSGVSCPIITYEIAEACLSKSFLSFSERKKRFFQFLIFKGYAVGETIYFNNAPDLVSEVSAWIEARSLHDAEFYSFRNLFTESKLLQALPAGGFTVLEKGWELIDSLISDRSNRNAFVAMWFDSSVLDAFRQHLEPALIACGFEPPFRVDQQEHTDKIDDRIIAMIRRSSLVVVDLTCAVHEQQNRAIVEARGGVYYEAGFASGLGIPVIWTCRADAVPHVHFDLRQYNQIIWTPAGMVETINKPIKLRDALTNRIKALKLST